jgi:hypothetical protein
VLHYRKRLVDVATYRVGHLENAAVIAAASVFDMLARNDPSAGAQRRDIASL